MSWPPGGEVRSATPAPITTLMVGYAAGLAAGSDSEGDKGSAEAIAQAAGTAAQLCEDGPDGGPASKGWADTAQ